jgi:two-component system sensor histidine kinase KdpD
MALFAFFVVAITVGQLSATAKRRAEEAERLFDELQEAFERASQAEALKRSEKLKSALLDAVTHDLRTPLTSIKAAITTLIEEYESEQIKLDPAGRREFFDVINEETDRLNNFIQGMVELAKIEAGALNGRKSWGSVQDMIDSAVQRAEKLIGSRHIIIENERDLPSIFVDSRSLSEVVYTLLDNAVKYSPADTPIRISARLAETGVIEIAVEDRGRGISPEMREKVFSKFYRSEDEEIHTTSSGLGLGLAIARGIVESQGGKIWIADGSDGYTTRVAFLIPVGDDEI